jgi:iron complex outermembrane receptor protein
MRLENNMYKHTLAPITAALLGLLPAAGTAQTVLEEVIVTAQKRTQNVMDVPISISVFNASMVEQLSARNLTDLGKFTAGVQMNNDNALQPTYTIRGIETNDWTVGSDPAVAVYVDGVYAARGAGAEAALADIDRVEILKGPQGTLFGRNATGGAIHIISQKPQLENEGRVKVTVGDYDRLDGELMYNHAFSDTLAVRGVIVTRERDGYVDQVEGPSLNEQDQQNYRASLLWDATPETEVLWRVEYSELDQRGAAQYTMVSEVFERANPGRRHKLFGDVNHDSPSQEKRDMFATSLEINQEIGDMTFTSITGYREFDTELIEDLDGSNNRDYQFDSSNPDDNDYFSQEFRLVGSTAKLNWTVGAGFSTENVDHTTTAIFNVSTLETFAWAEILRSPESETSQAFLSTFTDLTPDEIAALGELNDLEVGEVLPEFRDGMRETGLDGFAGASFVWSFLNDRGQLGDFGINENPFVGITQIFQDWGPRVASYDPWIEEYSSEGEFDSYAVYGDATYSLSERWNLTGGLRYTFDQKDFEVFSQYQNQIVGADFGLAFFNNGQALVNESQSEDWDNISGRIVLDYFANEEVMFYGSIATGFKSGGFNSLSFGPGIETSYDEEEVINYEVGMKGTFFDGSLQLTTAAFFYEYDNLQELDLIGSPVPSYNLRNADAEGYGGEIEWIWLITDALRFTGNYSYLDTEYTEFDIIPAAGETEEDDFTGDDVVGNPENKLNLGVEYQWGLGDFGLLLARADYSWTDEFQESLSNETQKVDDFDITNVRVSLLPNDAGWEVSLWSTNVFDEEAITVFGDNGNAIGSQTAWHVPPRMYGADFIYNF